MYTYKKEVPEISRVYTGTFVEKLTQ